VNRRRLAPIVLFVYNRPEHTRLTIEALKKNDLATESDLFIYSDSAKTELDNFNVSEVRNYIKGVSGFKSLKIIERSSNLGLAKSVISGVSDIINEYGRIIVLEDDLITSAQFLKYMNNMLNVYKKEQYIYSICGYNHPQSLMKIPQKYKFDIYLNPRAGSWSWATWKDRWQKADWDVSNYEEFLKDKSLQKAFNFGGEDMSSMLIKQMDGELDSWAIRWCYTLFKYNAFCVYPRISYVNNIGHDGSGVHCGKSKVNRYENCYLNMNSDLILPDVIVLDKKVMKNFQKVYKKNIIRKVIYKLVKNLWIYKKYRKLRNG